MNLAVHYNPTLLAHGKETAARNDLFDGDFRNYIAGQRPGHHWLRYHGSPGYCGALGIVSLGRHILLELGKGHWAALIYGPPVLLIIIWFGVMILTLWLHPIGWPSVLER